MSARPAIVVAILHLVVVFVHAAAHTGLGVFAGPLATVYIGLVIYAAPIVSIVLLMRGATRAGLGILWLSLIGSHAFGTYMHFIGISNDHVCHLPEGLAWQITFQITAGVMTIVDAVGIVLVPVWARRLLLEPVRGPFVLLIDGTCIFCNRLVSMVLERDREDLFRFAHLQSDYARDVRARHEADVEDIDGVYLIANAGTADEKLLLDGAAGRQLWPRLFWWATPMLLMPVALLNPSYRLTARYRYRLFGQYPVCKVPTESERSRVMA
jgi:predicted DCC family thiol-disulfide oxidoreductase YuxK